MIPGGFPCETYLHSIYCLIPAVAYYSSVKVFSYLDGAGLIALLRVEAWVTAVLVLGVIKAVLFLGVIKAVLVWFLFGVIVQLSEAGKVVT